VDSESFDRAATGRGFERASGRFFALTAGFPSWSSRGLRRAVALAARQGLVIVSPVTTASVLCAKRMP
jgi:hypothetical protein